MINDLLYKEIIERMKEFQSKLDYKTLGTEVLLLSLMSIEDSMTNLILKELKISIDDVLEIINNSYYLREPKNYTHTLKQVFDKAYQLQKNKDFVYYQEATNYWMKASMRIPYYAKNGKIETPAQGRILYFDDDIHRNIVFVVLNSSFFYLWYSTFSDGFHLTDNMVKTMPINSMLFNNSDLYNLANQLEEDIKTNSFITSRNTQKDKIELESFRINSSKNIIDEIDKALSKLYGFTEEELDFIINYDIKYRMGDELNE